MITGDKEMRLDHFLQQVLQFELSQMFLSEKKKKKGRKRIYRNKIYLWKQKFLL